MNRNQSGAAKNDKATLLEPSRIYQVVTAAIDHRRDRADHGAGVQDRHKRFPHS